MATSTIKVNSQIPRYVGHSSGAGTLNTSLTSGMYLFVFGYVARPERNGLVLVTVRSASAAANITVVGGKLAEVTVTDGGSNPANNGRIIEIGRTVESGSIPLNVFYMGETN